MKGRERWGQSATGYKGKTRKEHGYSFILLPIHSAHSTLEEFSLEDDY